MPESSPNCLWSTAQKEVQVQRLELEKKAYSNELEIVRIIEEFIKEQLQGEDISPTAGETR